MYLPSPYILAAILSAGSITFVATDADLNSAVSKARGNISGISVLVKNQHTQLATALFEADTGRAPTSEAELAKDNVYLDLESRDKQIAEFNAAAAEEIEKAKIEDAARNASSGQQIVAE